MKNFYYFNATTVDEAVDLLSKTDDRTKDLTYGKVNAGSTDLVGVLRHRILPEDMVPDFLVNIKSIPGLKYISEDAEGLKIGALTTVEELRTDSTVKSKYGVLAQAAARTSTWQLRAMGTVGGNIAQDSRCWYYRVHRNRFDCIRKGGAVCYLQVGQNQFGSVFGGPGGCYMSHPSDLAPALIALDASLKISGSAGERTVKLEEFYTSLGNVLEEDEIITEVSVPAPASGAKGAFLKVATRRAIDFSTVSVAVVVSPGDARIVLGAVFPIPYRRTAAEDVVKGGGTAEAAADAAVADAFPLDYNAYKVDIVKALVKRAVTASM